MKRNGASQIVGVQMVSATDGSAFTGTVTVYVTGDGGTQAIGSVGSGICTHEGNGLHSYAPAQAETNYDHIAFTFIGTGAVPATIQVFPAFPQTGDNFARLGAPVGASISADIALVQSDTDNLQTRIPAALVSGRIDASVGSYPGNTAQTGDNFARLGAPVGASISADVATRASQASLDTLDNFVDTEVADIQARLPAALTADGNIKADALRIAGTVQSAGDLAAMVTVVDDLLDAEIGAIKAKTDNLPASPAAVSDIPTAAVVADAVWDEDATAHQTQGSFGQAIGDPGADTDTLFGLINTNLNATVSSRASQTSVDDLPTNAELTTALGTADDAVLGAIAALTIPSAAANADAVWDETLSGHAGAGSAGEALDAAGGAGDPWITALPGAYGAGSAGKIVGDNINATISSRSSHAAADVWAVGTRTLSSFGTLVADIATAVWGAATRTLSAFGFSVTVGTNSDKTGYALTSGERTAIANEVETQIIDEADAEKVLTAITDKIAAVNPDLGGLTVAAIASAVWSAATRILTAGTNIVLAKGVGVTGFNDLSAAQVNVEADTALADYDGPTNAELATALATADDAVLTAIGALNNLSQANVRTALGMAAADLDTQLDVLTTIQTLISELHKIQGLDITSPMTVTPSSRVAGAVNLGITGDGITTSTVTRQ